MQVLKAGPQDMVEPLERRLENGALRGVADPQRPFSAGAEDRARRQPHPLLDEQPSAERKRVLEAIDPGKT